MSEYTVVLQINVPGLGARTVTQTQVVAPNITQAIATAVATITIDATQVQKTA